MGSQQHIRVLNSTGRWRSQQHIRGFRSTGRWYGVSAAHKGSQQHGEVEVSVQGLSIMYGFEYYWVTELSERTRRFSVLNYKAKPKSPLSGHIWGGGGGNSIGMHRTSNFWENEGNTLNSQLCPITLTSSYTGVICTTFISHPQIAVL